MKLLTHIAAMVASLVLALPPGVCCAALARLADDKPAAASDGDASSAEPQHRCCQRVPAARLHKPAIPAVPGCQFPGKTAPMANCCCARHVPPPETAKPRLDVFDAWGAWPVTVAADELFAAAAIHRLTEPIYSRPRLHLL
jgi:hypothetical protein